MTRIRREHALDDASLVVETGEAAGGEQAERDGTTVRERVAGRSFERVREGVAEVELRSIAAVEGVTEADRRLGGGTRTHLRVRAELPQRLADQQARLHHLGETVAPFLLGQRLEERRVDHGRDGQWNAPTRFFPSGRSMPTFPPIAASTWPTSVDGTAIQSIPRR